MIDNLDLFILDTAMGKNCAGCGSPHAVFHAVTLARSGSNIAIGQLDMSGSLFTDMNLFKSKIEMAISGKMQRPKESELTDFGHQLFRLLFTGDLLALYNRLPSGNIRVHILSDEPAIKGLPWEYLQDPNFPCGPQAERCIVRIIPTIGRDAPQPLQLSKNNIRILFCYAAPIDEPGISLEEVQQTIERAYNARIPSGFAFTYMYGTSRESLLATLQKGHFDIFHFLGHGEVKNGIGQLVIVDENGKSTLLAAEELAVLLNGKKICLAILSACKTAAGSFANDFTTVAGALIKTGIPAVVANQLSIPNKSIAAFVGALYSELLGSGDIDQAVNEGRKALAIGLGGIGEEAVLEWGVPTLYRLLGANRIFSI